MKLKAIVFICGSVVMALELLGSRIIAPFYGNSLYAWGSLIGVILGALSIGYFLGGKRADKGADYYGLSMIMLKAGFFIALIPVMSSVILNPVFVIPMGMKYGPLVSVLILFSVPSVYLGMVSPYAVKIEAKKLSVLGSTAGSLYAISTLGSIFGTFATSFFLIPEIGVRLIIYGLSAVLILASVVCAGKKILSNAFIVSACFGVIILVWSSYGSADGSGMVVFQKDSVYYEIKVVDYPGTSIRMLYLDGTLTGAMYYNSSKAVFNYTDYFHLPFIVNPEIKEVLFIGGGAGTGPKRFYDSYSQVNIDVVDIDPEVNKAAADYFDLKENDRTKIYTDEGRAFLSKTSKKYDLIVIDAFNSMSSIPYHLMTKEFMEEASKHLSRKGMTILNMHGSIQGAQSGLFLTEYKTYKSVFPNVYVFPVGKDPAKLQNIMILASKEDKEYSKQEFIDWSANVSKKTGITELPQYAGKLLEREPVYDGPILTDDYAPVDNLILPILDRYYTK